MILDPGSKVLVVHRRLFENDGSRFFFGVVDAYEQAIAKVTGYSWTLNQIDGTFLSNQEKRTKIFALSSGTLIVYELPRSIDISKMKLEYTTDGSIFLKGPDFQMNLTEREHHRPVKKK